MNRFGSLCLAVALPSLLAAQRPDFTNSPRFESLIRAGNLYLSLPDALALALENNLDIQLQRATPELAATDLLRARGGGTLRNVPLTVAEAPAGIGGPASPLLNAPATGTTASTAIPTSVTELAVITPGQSTPNVTESTPLSTGTPLPVFDPSLNGSVSWLHATVPQNNPLITGTDSLVTSGPAGSAGIGQGFATGASVHLDFNSAWQRSNSARNVFNPFNTSSLGLTVTQPLLRGFGAAMNRRFIRIAQNNRRISALLFRQQVISTVAGAIRLYNDFVSLTEDVRVKQQALALAERLLADNRAKVNEGTLAPIELVRAQAQVAASRQDLANSQGFAAQQELILKSYLTRRGTADPIVAAVRIIATTPIEVPAAEPARPVDDLVRDAFTNRPELESSRLQLANSRISLEGSHNATLPQLDVFGVVENNGLAGDGGTGMAQLFRRNYPTYGAGIELNLPLRNRIAEADYARDRVQVERSAIRRQQLTNQVRLEVEGALIALQRSRAALDAAIETRKLQEQSLSIEMERYQAGLSTSFLVMQYQGFLAQARSTEVAARDTYSKARTALDRALGTILETHGIILGEVLRGTLSTPLK
ncbi:MAG: TolC family protein [Bryobacterales bacterium]|nr:TolC family protein [Bryobacterales bacterium]